MDTVTDLNIEKMGAEECPPVKLNIGGGNPKDEHYAERKGYVLIDRSVGKEAYPLDYPDDSVDEIYASHILEHFPYEKVQDVVNDWVRALKPGGSLKIGVPNFAFFANAYKKQTNMNLNAWIMGGHKDNNDVHGSLFDKEVIREVMAKAGLQRLGEWKPEIRDSSAITYKDKGISCNWMGFKPHGVLKTLPDVQAVLSCPRFAPVMHFRCIINACGGLQIYTTFVQGCYWWMQICEAMEKALEAPGVKYILTLDYDSIFSKEEIMELYNLMETYPEVDVLCGLQSKRGEDTVLLGMEEEMREVVNQMTFARNVTQVTTGHFGLTMFRADKLRHHPRPWMVGKPSPEGSWNRDSDAVHPDIDFWYRWRDAGLTLYVANKVVVGHMIEHIMWPGQNFTPIYQDLPDYATNGIPPEAVR